MVIKAVSAQRAMYDRDVDPRHPWTVRLYTAQPHSDGKDGIYYRWDYYHILATLYGEDTVVDGELLNAILDMARRRGVPYIPNLWVRSTDGLGPLDLLGYMSNREDECLP